MKLCNENLCTGCGCCKNICPVSAVEFVANNTGACVWQINASRCTGCGLCVRSCPVNKSSTMHEPKHCYAVWAKNTDHQRRCASAGFVTAMYEKVLDHSGVVYGTRYENENLVFAPAETKEELAAFRGSRYTQADTGAVFQTIKQQLKAGRQVLFTGTPCQVDGLRCYLGKEYENLILVDLICHGVAPKVYLQEYLKTVVKGKSYDTVQFRGQNGLKLAVYSENRELYVKPKAQDLYYTAYLQGLIHRENCYTCKYAGLSRCSDITAGDFWGLNKSTVGENTLRTDVPSLAFVNTEKGARFFQSLLGEYINSKEYDIARALPYNKQLREPCGAHPERNLFLREYASSGFVNAVKKTSIKKAVARENIKYKAALPYKAVKRIGKIILKK